jgi:hypothetical protein
MPWLFCAVHRPLRSLAVSFVSDPPPFPLANLSLLARSEFYNAVPALSRVLPPVFLAVFLALLLSDNCLACLAGGIIGPSCPLSRFGKKFAKIGLAAGETGGIASEPQPKFKETPAKFR